MNKLEQTYRDNKIDFKKMESIVVQNGGNNKDTWSLYDKNQKARIEKDYNDIISSKKQCNTFPLKKLVSATSGRDLYDKKQHITKNILCEDIADIKKNNSL